LKITIILFLIPIISLSQKEADNWYFHNKLSLNFATGTPILSYTNSEMFSYRRCSTISDSIGNLLFYANDDTIWGKNNTVLTNGINLMSISAANKLSGTQGICMIQKPKSDHLFYYFNMGLYTDQRLEYAVIDKDLNSGIGSVISKNIVLMADDTLTEKLAIAKHCNNNDLWVVVVKKSVTSNYCYFCTYLLNSYGLNHQPVISKIKTTQTIPLMGQMKFNAKGTILAWASQDGVELFNFNNQTGVFTYKQNFNYNFENGLGIEFSPNNQLLYINRFQLNITTGNVTPLVTNILPTKLQLATDGKIYAHIYACNSYTPTSYDGNFLYPYYSLVDKLNLGRITNPDISGTGCNIDTNFISNYSYQTPYPHGGWSLPDFPAYYFYNPKSDFKYSGNCISTPIQFYNNESNIDSLRWCFLDNNATATGTLVSHNYSSSGNYEVMCIAYYNNTSDTSKHCVNIAGQGNSNLPKQITICEGTDTIINGLQTFGYKYLWSTGDTTSATKISKSGIYTLSYQTPCGISIDTMEVKAIYCDMDYEIPNVFTPNNDGINDLFTIKLKNIKHISYHIYNRWGIELQNKNENINIFNYEKYTLWDGLINNNLADNGTYFYLIELTPFKGENVKLKGFLNLF
jgi:gliding motility-associated-like protein